MNFTWHGKENAIIESMTPSTGTLRPDKESSKNWDDTENLYIEGDNLEVLKLLQKSYSGKVKMIYIDPPYNTGKDFIYKDNFRDNIANYKEITSQTTKANPETNGRYHTDWLNMMYPRLKLARNLLREDGVIFISIDDTEVANIRKLCDEIFGENNLISQVIWQRAFSPVNMNRFFSSNHDHILVYAKNKESIDNFGLPRSQESNSRYSNPDNDKRGVWTSGDFSVGPAIESKIYPIITPSGKSIYPPSGRCWRVTKERFEELKNDNRVWFGENGDNVPRLKRFLSEVQNKNVPLTVWTYEEVGHSQSAKKELNNLFDGKAVMDYPKSLKLLERIIQLNDDENAIILDFFSGSSTTAHGVLNLNNLDNKKRKFIMVQLPEETDEKSEAYKSGYKNICEIGKERIRRAGDKIVSENKDKEGIENLDIGFKVFKLEYNCGGENYSMMKEGIKVDIIKKPKDKPICKFKVCDELYYLVKTSNDIIVFPYNSSIKGKVIASIFNIELCKDKDYMQLEYLYNMKLNEFNGEDFIHSQYVTNVILDNVYQNLKD